MLTSFKRLDYLLDCILCRDINNVRFVEAAGLTCCVNPLEH